MVMDVSRSSSCCHGACEEQLRLYELLPASDRHRHITVIIVSLPVQQTVQRFKAVTSDLLKPSPTLGQT